MAILIKISTESLSFADPLIKPESFTLWLFIKNNVAFKLPLASRH